MNDYKGIGVHGIKSVEFVVIFVWLIEPIVFASFESVGPIQDEKGINAHNDVADENPQKYSVGN